MSQHTDAYFPVFNDPMSYGNLTAAQLNWAAAYFIMDKQTTMDKTYAYDETYFKIYFKPSQVNYAKQPLSGMWEF